MVPSEIADTDSVREADLIAVAIYLPAALIVGVIWGNRRAATVRAFLREERPPTPEERRGVLRAPLGVAKISGVLWGGAVVLFAVLNLTFSLDDVAG